MHPSCLLERRIDHSKCILTIVNWIGLPLRTIILFLNSIIYFINSKVKAISLRLMSDPFITNLEWVWYTNDGFYNKVWWLWIFDDVIWVNKCYCRLHGFDESGSQSVLRHIYSSLHWWHIDLLLKWEREYRSLENYVTKSEGSIIIFQV